MHCTRKVTEDLYWVGANDKRLHSSDSAGDILQFLFAER